MATRPIFLSTTTGSDLVRTLEIEFEWFPGFSVSQKQKSIHSLHGVAISQGVNELLEVSSKSLEPLGQRLSAFNLTALCPEGQKSTLECIFQGSKKFENGGPYTDLYYGESLEAKKDERLKSSGRLVGFTYGNVTCPLEPQTAFYDWLYLRALQPHADWLIENCKTRVFTDIEFNPKKSINCQAHSLALFFSLYDRKLLNNKILEDPKLFIELLKHHSASDSLF